jgi:glycerol-3-phosphate dehydrogenase subunit C
MENIEPEYTARMVVDACSDCDVCRFLMDSNCLMFPELYRLYDKEIETGKKINSDELRKLVDLCNFCALCPCPNIRADIIKAKTQFIERDGLKFGVRTLEDVERVGKLCGMFPRLTNFLFKHKLSGELFKSATGIHIERRIPEFPHENFPQWAKKQGLNTQPKKQPSRKLAYFAGCTANYLFPDVPKAVVDVFRHNGFEVYYPDQKCCGMPTLLEGDRKLTMEFVRFNLEHLAEAVENGYDIVCSCPTCGFMLRNMLKEGAYFSPEYQESVGADEAYIKIPLGKAANNPGDPEYKLVKKDMYEKILKDDSYFSTLSPLKRISVAEHTYDLGDFLANLLKSGELKTTFGPVSGHMVYYPPCHLREQNIGRPYLDLLNIIPGITLEPIKGNLFCCGMAGIMGFKEEFHQASIQLGDRLMQKIKALNPENIVTDCLSCRLQFTQLTPHRVIHPIEVLNQAYGRFQSQKEKRHTGKSK